jgi:hypothetical protein
MDTSGRQRSIEEWAHLLEVDPSILTPADAEWFEQEERWVANARHLVAEALEEYPEEQDILLAQGDS